MNNKAGRWLIGIVVFALFAWYVISIINNKQQGRDPNVLTLWIAPQDVQAQFWSIVVDDWNKSGLGMKVVYNTIQTSGSSEESILNSIVSNTNPDICDNIFAGFVAQLAELKSVHNLKEFEGFDELVKSRQMERIMKGWEKDGEEYVMPMYSNPIMYWWRGDKLKENGWDKPPETYSELNKLAEKVTIPHRQYAIKLFVGRNWWDRWSDFIAYYYAASDGQPYIVDNKAAIDNQYSKEVLDFYYKAFNNNWSLIDVSISEAFWQGTLLGEIHGPWDIPYAQNTYPEVLKSVIISPVLVPDSHKGLKYTLADTKGLVIFKTCQHPEEAWKFLRWLFSQEKYSMLWLEKTEMPPARGDLMTNPIFQEYYKNHPYSKAYAEYVGTALPPALITNTIDVQQAMTNYIMEPLMYKTGTVDSCLKIATKKINDMLEGNEL